MGLSAFEMAEYQIRDMFIRIGTEDASYKLLVNITENADSYTIQALASFLNTTELAFGRLAGKGKERSIAKVISLEQLKKYENIFLLRLKEISEEVNLLEMKNARMVLYLFKSFAEEEYKAYMEEQLMNDHSILIYLSFSSSKWMGDSGVGWEYNENYRELIDDSRANKAIERCIEDKSILDLDYDVLQRVAAYVLWKEDITRYDGNVIQSDVNSKIMQWKENQ